MGPISLYDLAHARSGDKGNRLNIAVVCHDPAHFALLDTYLTEAFVAEVFESRKPTSVKKYRLPRLYAFNFVLDDVLDGGVNSSLGLDGHGKTLSYLLLQARLPITPSMLSQAPVGPVPPFEIQAIRP